MTKEQKIKKEELRQIPIKNYFTITIIFVLSIGLAFFFRNWYNSYQDYEKTTPVLNGVISEIHYNEIDNFIIDNQSAIIFIGVADDDDCRNIETKLKKVIEKRHLKNKIIYFNITEVEDRSLLLEEFNGKYGNGYDIYTYPAIVLIEDGRVVDYRSKNANKNLLISDIEQLLDEYKVQGDY